MVDSHFTIFVVEDNEWYNKMLQYTLSLNPSYLIKGFESGKELLSALHEKPNVVTLDYRLPDMNGLEVIEKLKEISPDTDIIAISEQQDIETAVELIKKGAYDYIVKSKDIRNQLLYSVQKIAERQQLRAQVKSLQQEVGRKYEFKKTIIGESDSIKKVFELMQKAVDNNITVLVSGETGTGKEVVAKAIHYNSNRAKEPFIAVNMAAIPADLIESELFGHEKGAFTGAIARRKGKFEEAGNGTLFLDEIGEMKLEFQAKLLRSLQEKEVTRIGGNTAIKTNCRIVVATNKDLRQEMKAGNFREDLYYRLFGLPIELPPLRERGKDILLLARFFIKAFCDENEYPEKILSETACKKLLSYRWPGNIRELKSVVDLSVVMSQSTEIQPSDIIVSTDDALTSVMVEEMTLREYNIRIVKLFMDRYNENMKLVAEKLGIGQTTVYRMLKEDEDSKQ
ncbi:response regulator [bacterium]|nr:response regulator [bacterium]